MYSDTHKPVQHIRVKKSNTKDVEKYVMEYKINAAPKNMTAKND